MNTPSKVCFVPDTNFFIQCHSASDLDWAEVGEYAEVNLILCRPVLGEIDNFKYKGNTRLARRAKNLNSQLREILSTLNQNIVVKESNPKVSIVLDLFCKPDPSLDTLDYSKVDNEIVGICCQLTKLQPDKDVRLLSHDTGPLLVARALNLPHTLIPDNWLLDPENTASEKEVKRLNEEAARLKSNEPKFRIVCLNSMATEAEALEYEFPVYDNLSDCEISGFTDMLRSKFPINNFDVPLMNSLYMPPSNEELDKYKQEHTSWIEQCVRFLKCIHSPDDDTGILDICFLASNEGTRPAKDALVTIQAHGDLKISPPPGDYDDYPDETSLPSPPIPPKMRPTGIGQMAEMLKGIAEGNYLRGIPDLNSPTPSQDPNGFYYKNKPAIPNRLYSVKCEQWRHGTGDEDFHARIYYNRSKAETKGMLECVIHAENLSEPVRKKIPIRIVAQRKDGRDYVHSLIDELVESSH